MGLYDVSTIVSGSTVAPSYGNLATVVRPNIQPVVTFTSLPITDAQHSLASATAARNSLGDVLPFLSRVDIFSIPESVPVSLMDVVCGSLAFGAGTTTFNTMGFGCGCCVLGGVVSRCRGLGFAGFFGGWFTFFRRLGEL